jgi:hypothetical protein
MSSTAQRIKVSDIAPTTLRLAPALRDELMRQASISGRSLSQEISQRLQASLHGDTAPLQKHGVQSHVGRYEVSKSAPLPDAHRQLLALFEALTPDRQLALLTLLKR